MEDRSSTNSQKSPCNQPAITAIIKAQPYRTTNTATNNAPYSCPITTSTLVLQTSIIAQTLLTRDEHPAPAVQWRCSMIWHILA